MVATVQRDAVTEDDADYAAYWAYETAASLVMEFGLDEAAALCRKASWDDVLEVIQTEWQSMPAAQAD